MIAVAAIKRKAKFAGEVGLYGADQVADEELKRLTNDEMVWAEITTPKNIDLLRYLWAIAQKLADGGLYQDKDDAMEDLKIRARFARFAQERGRIVIVPRSLSKQRKDVLSRLADRFVYIICADLLPQMKPSEFRKEIEDMVS
jgi:hypothetical protein